MIGRRAYTITMLSVGFATQIIAYLWEPVSPWAVVSGCLGICNVVFCAQGNIITFFFGLAQIFTYSYLCYLEHFYAGLVMNVFYLVTTLYAIWCWRKRLMLQQNADAGSVNLDRQVPARTIGTKWLIVLISVMFLCSALVGWLLSIYTDDTQPYLDAYTTIPALAAQILMMLAFRENWVLWLVIDILYIILWTRAGNYCMVMQYIIWCVNCLYGYITWTRSLENRY